MAANPTFTATPRLFFASLTSANTARDGSGPPTTLTQAGTSAMGASGTKITSIGVITTGDAADSIVNIFIQDGTTWWFYDSFDLGNPAAPSATVDAYRAVKSYPDLVLPSGYTIGAAITAAPTSGAVNVFAHGGDF